MFGRMFVGLAKNQLGPQHAGDFAMSADKCGDWGFRKIVRVSPKHEEKSAWGFREAINDAIAVVEAEQNAQREREAAEKARLEKARQKAMTVQKTAIIPLLNDLSDHFAADEKKILPEWQIQSDEHADKLTFRGEATTPDLTANGAKYFTIKAEASVAEQGDAVNLSVVCSWAERTNTSADQLAPLYNKTKKFLMQPKFDESGSRTWFYRHLTECARMCVLTKMRQFPATEADRMSCAHEIHCARDVRDSVDVF